MDEANEGEEPDGDVSEKKDDKLKDRGVKLRVLVNGKYATYQHDDCEVGGCDGGCKNTFEKYVPAVSWCIVVIDLRVSLSALILGGDFYGSLPQCWLN